MGKPVDVELGGAGGIEIAGGGGGGGGCSGFCAPIGRVVSFRCVFMLLLAVGVLVPALFLLLPSRHVGYLSDDPDVLAGEVPYLYGIEFQSRLLRGVWGLVDLVGAARELGVRLGHGEADRWDGAAIAASRYQVL